MPDTSYLHWPFFEDTHRTFEAKIRSWCTSNCHPEPPSDIEPPPSDIESPPTVIESPPTVIESPPSVILSLSKDPEPDSHGIGTRGALNGTPAQLVKSYVKSLAEAGLLQPCLDLDVRTLCIARESLAYHDALADFAFAMQGLGSGPISLFGTAEQKARYLPGVANGEQIMAFALSEREAGSDVAATACAARRDGDSYIIDGGKTWISNAGIADVYVLFARTADAGAKGLSAFIVPAQTPGVSSGRRSKRSPRTRSAACSSPAPESRLQCA